MTASNAPALRAEPQTSPMLIITFYSAQTRRDLSTAAMPRDAAQRYIAWLSAVSFVSNIRVYDATTRERVLS